MELVPYNHWINEKTNRLWVVMDNHWHDQGITPKHERPWGCCVRLNNHVGIPCTEHCIKSKE